MKKYASKICDNYVKSVYEYRDFSEQSLTNHTSFCIINHNGMVGTTDIILEEAYMHNKPLAFTGKKSYMRFLFLVVGILLFMAMVTPFMVSCNNLQVGDSVFIGKYPFHRDGSYKQIEWLVLTIHDGKALVISRYNLDIKPYYTKHDEVTWETSSIRKWLNNSFIETAFSAEDQAKIVETTLINADNPEYSTNGGQDTVDRVFLLSIDEVKKHMPFEINRESFSTLYAKEQGAYVNGKNGSSWWALRSPGADALSMATINDGKISYEGDGVDSTDYALRPAMWIEVK
ncbi:MAG TPA: hypothetical protein DCY74_07375 [Clostridiales bacterium]|nr:hypothetical protein [Clostridiales bacterium]HBE13974.1 hypothetical protein [Clostridiales bacterium]HCG36217.1 hypothetical protein [Clostridiales bacterium]